MTTKELSELAWQAVTQALEYVAENLGVNFVNPAEGEAENWSAFATAALIMQIQLQAWFKLALPEDLSEKVTQVVHDYGLKFDQIVYKKEAGDAKVCGTVREVFQEGARSGPACDADDNGRVSGGSEGK